MMRFMVLLAITACGGSTAPIGSKPGAQTPVSPWAKILKQGAVWHLEATGHSVTITVASVTTVNGVTTAQLAFSSGGKQIDATAPTTITLDAKGVRLDDLQYPGDAKPVKFPDGRYITVHDGEICYGSGPGENAGECADVCDANMCIDDTGISGGLGTWWPDDDVYRRKK
jgi:hypothetical protein